MIWCWVSHNYIPGGSKSRSEFSIPRILKIQLNKFLGIIDLFGCPCSLAFVIKENNRIAVILQLVLFGSFTGEFVKPKFDYVTQLVHWQALQWECLKFVEWDEIFWFQNVLLKHLDNLFFIFFVEVTLLCSESFCPLSVIHWLLTHRLRFINYKHNM